MAAGCWSSRGLTCGGRGRASRKSGQSSSVRGASTGVQGPPTCSPGPHGTGWVSSTWARHAHARSLPCTQPRRLARLFVNSPPRPPSSDRLDSICDRRRHTNARERAHLLALKCPTDPRGAASRRPPSGHSGDDDGCQVPDRPDTLLKLLLIILLLCTPPSLPLTLACSQP